MSKIKIALIGPGDVAQRDYLPEFHRIAHKAEIVDVCGRNETRAKATAEKFGAHWHTDYAAMLQRTEAEAVLNLTPFQLHTEITLAALQAGKHVFSEKPVALSLSEAKQIQAEAKARSLTIVCAPCVMIFPQVMAARQRIEAGEIGAVHFARGRGWGGVPPWGGYTSDPAPFFARGGGPLRDMGVYPLHALTGLLGPVQRVMAMSAQVQREFVPTEGLAIGKRIPIEEPDLWTVLLDFGNGRLAMLESNNAAQSTRAPELEFFGLRGSLGLSLIDVGAPVDVMKAEGDWGWVSHPTPPTGRASGPDHILGVAHLVDCIQQHRAPILSIEHAAHVVAVIDAAYVSAREGRAVEIEELSD